MKKILLMFLFILVLSSLLIGVSFAQDGDILNEDFLNSQLDSSWNVTNYNGYGRYSLTDNFGNLRYYLEGSRGYSGSWYQANSSWHPTTTLTKSFEGENWIFEGKANYNLHQRVGNSSTGAQRARMHLVFGNNNDNFLYLDRGVDYWYNSNFLAADVRLNGEWANMMNGVNFKDPNDIDKNEWLRHEYWYRVERLNQNIKLFISYDGINFNLAIDFDLPDGVEGTQRIILDQIIWTSAGSYVDWDYFRVTENNPYLDEIVPEITINNIIDEEVYENSVTPEITITDNESGIASQSIKLDCEDYVSGTEITENGLHKLEVTATDNAGNTSSKSISFVVYSPYGQISGGGWILEGSKKSNFGFTLKYKNDKPTGNFEFQSKESDINLKSEQIDWLAINGNRTTFQGTGTIKGMDGKYTFRVDCLDVDVDKLTITIWEVTDTEAKPIYEILNSDLGGGNIKVKN